MRPVVDTGHDEAEEQHRDREALGLLADVRAAAAAAVVEERPDQAEDGGRGADGDAGALQERRQEGHDAGETAGGESADACDGVHDHRPPRAVEPRRGRGEVAHPQHVEQDVQHAAVEPARAQQRPPVAVAEHGAGAAGAEAEQALEARREEGQEPGVADALGVRGEAREVERAAGPRHQHREAHVVADVAQERREAPHSRVAAPAAQALRVVHADERAAGGTENRGRPSHGEFDDTRTRTVRAERSAESLPACFSAS